MTPELHKCASPVCPGFTYAASSHRHPCRPDIRVHVTPSDGLAYVATLAEMVKANDPGSIDDQIRWALEARPGEERRFPGHQSSYLWYVVDEFEDLNLTVRTKNVLIDARLRFPNDVRALSDREILRMRNAGRRTLDELRAYGLRLDACSKFPTVPGCELPVGHTGPCRTYTRHNWAPTVVTRAPPPGDVTLVHQDGSRTVGPYAVLPDGSQVVLYRDQMPAEVRVAWESLNTLHRVAGPLLRAHFNADRIVLERLP